MKKRNNMKAAALAGGILISSALIPGCAQPESLGTQPDPGQSRADSYEQDLAERTSMVHSDFCVAENMLPCVYGPPPDETDFLPEDNNPEEVYGPPPEESSSWSGSNEPEQSDFLPEDNFPQTVYGPPPSQSLLERFLGWISSLFW